MALHALTAANQEYLRNRLTSAQLLAVEQSTAIFGVGLSFLKLDGQLKAPKAIAYSLQGCELRNSARLASLALVCIDCGQAMRAKELSEATLVVKRTLNLLRSPIRHTGVELGGQGVAEAKIYLQTNIKDERLVDGDIQHSACRMEDDLRVLEQLGLALKIDVEQAIIMTRKMRRVADLGLDMVGLDLRKDRRIELKLYFAPPEGLRGLSGQEGYAVAERALSAIHESSMDDPPPGSLIALHRIMYRNAGLCLNQISAEAQPSGAMKIKLYFDLWKREKTFEATESAAAFSVEELEGLRGAFDETGISFPSLDDILTLHADADKGEFVLDAFCLETLGTEGKLKIYIRPAGNTDGDGMVLEGACT